MIVSSAPKLRPKDTLTPREQELIACVSRGLSIPEAAAVMGISRQTIRNHLRAIYDKVGASDLKELRCMYCPDKQKADSEMGR